MPGPHKTKRRERYRSYKRKAKPKKVQNFYSYNEPVNEPQPVEKPKGFFAKLLSKFKKLFK